jgi:hypothetical protein
MCRHLPQTEQPAVFHSATANPAKQAEGGSGGYGHDQEVAPVNPVVG